MATDADHNGVAGFVYYSNVAVGLIAVAFVWGNYALLGQAPGLPLLVLAGCGTFLIYQFERGSGFAPEDRYNHPRRQAWLRRHAPLQRRLAAAALVIALLMLPFLRPVTLVGGSVLAMLGVLYALPLLPGGRRLKALWFVKPLAIAGGWAAGGVLLPALEAGLAFSPVVAGLVAYRLLFILPNALLVDWLDREGDARAGLRTVATVWPAEGVRFAAALLALLAAACAVAAAVAGAGPLWSVDALGPLLMAGVAFRLPALPRPQAVLLLDGLAAWPLVTALAAGAGV